MGSGDERDGGRAETVPERRGRATRRGCADTFGGAPAHAGLVVDCANGAAVPVARSAVFPAAQLIGIEPDGRNINAGVGSTHLDALAAVVRERGAACGIAFDGDADRCLAVDDRGEVVNGDAILAVLAIDRHERGELPGDRVVVTSMTNLGFQRRMREHGIAVEVTDVGDRYVLDADARDGGDAGRASSPATSSISTTTPPATGWPRR